MPAVRTTKTKAKAIKPHSKATTSSDDTAGSSTSSNDEQKPKGKPRAWTPAEEAHFKAKAVMILKRDLWADVKDHPGIKARQSSGVKAHIEAMFKKL